MKLAELQRFFAEAATSNAGPRAGLESVFVTDARLSASSRLGIYNRAYYYRLLDALASVFEQVRRSLGEAEFRRVGLSYLAQHPSEHPALERVGRLFPAYLRARALDEALVGLAELEWARLCALVAPNPAAVVTRANVDPAKLPASSLRLVPSLRWFELAAGALSAFAGEPLTTAAAPDHVAVAVWRQHHVVRHRQLGGLESQALRLAAQGASTSEICTIFDTGDVSQDVPRAFEILSSWFDREWVEGLAAPGS
ncbi:MAG: DNA-binding domain-containing protein [Pseudomonadota bacterium]